MPDTVINMPPRPAAAAVRDTTPAEAAGAGPGLPDLRSEIRELIEARPPGTPDDAALLAMMGQHDAALGAAIKTLPERDGLGGAVLAALAKKYRGRIDCYLAARALASALIFWPEPVPADEPLEEAILRLCDFDHDAARELARAHVYLGPRFALAYSLRVVLEKYGIPPNEFNATINAPAGGLTPEGLEAMLGQGQIELANELLKPFAVAIRQKIGTVRPVYSIVQGTNGRHVMPANELIEFLRKRDVFA